MNWQPHAGLDTASGPHACCQWRLLLLRTTRARPLRHLQDDGSNIRYAGYVARSSAFGALTSKTVGPVTQNFQSSDAAMRSGTPVPSSPADTLSRMRTGWCYRYELEVLDKTETACISGGSVLGCGHVRLIEAQAAGSAADYGNLDSSS